MDINPGEILEKVRKTKPLIHSITNYVTVNDCANMLIACGGSPIMAEDNFHLLCIEYEHRNFEPSNDSIHDCSWEKIQ